MFSSITRRTSNASQAVVSDAKSITEAKIYIPYRCRTTIIPHHDAYLFILEIVIGVGALWGPPKSVVYLALDVAKEVSVEQIRWW